MLSVAVYIGDIGQLWVAGHATPGAQIRLETDSGDVLKDLLWADHIGVFDQFLPITSEPRGQLVARSIGRRTFRSAPITIRSLRLADLPLARTVHIHSASDKTTLALEILLPAAHPYFRALAQGYISADYFTNVSFGYLKVSSFGGSSLSVYNLTPTLTFRSTDGIARLEGSWDSGLSAFSLSQSSPYHGMGGVPLRSAKDQVILHFSELRPAWFDDPLPAELTGDAAIWRGPLPTQTSTQIVGFGMTMLQGPRLEEQPREKTGVEEEESERDQMTFREFLAAFESREAPDFFYRTWRLLIALIPYAGLLWLARSLPFGGVEAWQFLVATTVVLAVWRSWSYFYWLATISSDVWLGGAIAPILFPLFGRVVNSGGHYQAFIDAGANAFWLLFVVFVALVPFYLPAVARAGLNWRPEPARPHLRSGLRRALVRSWGAWRCLYGVATLAMPLVATYLIWPHRGIALLTEEVRLSKLGSPPMLNWLQTWLSHPVFASLLPFGLLTLFLLTLGGRTALFGLGLLAVARHVTVTYHVTSGRPADELSALAVIGQVPWWAVLIPAGLATYPLFLRLVRMLAPFARDRPRLYWLLAAGLIVAALGLPHLPAQGMLVIGGCLREMHSVLPTCFGWLPVWADFFPTCSR